MGCIENTQHDGGAQRASVTPSAEQFRQIARRLSRAAREIEIVNSLSGWELYLYERDVARREAAVASRAAENTGAQPAEHACRHLWRLQVMTEYVEAHACCGTAMFAHAIGEIDPYGLKRGQRRGLFMELVMLRSAGKTIPQRLIDKYMTDADRAERFMRLLAA